MVDHGAVEDVQVNKPVGQGGWPCRVMVDSLGR